MELLLSLETEVEFQNAVIDFRKKFGINTATGSSQIKGANPSKVLEDMQYFINKIITDRKISVTYPYFYFKYIYGYMLYNKWPFDQTFPDKVRRYFTPPAKYIVVNEPIAISKNGKIVQYSKTVSLITYARLSATEFNEAVMELKEMQTEYLDPKLNRRFRPSQDFEGLLKIADEMDTRELPHKVEKVKNYVAIVKKDYERGKTSEAEYKRVRNLNPRDIENVKIGKTSGDVAQKFLGKKRLASNARQMVVRLKKKQQSFKLL